MSRVAKAIKMLLVLKSRGKLSRKELSELLDETPRNILNLKKDLEETGYVFHSTPGKNGGYELDTNKTMIPMYFTDKDQDTLRMLQAYVSKDQTLLNQGKYADLLDRMIVSTKDMKEDFYQVYNSVTLLRERSELETIYDQVRYAIENQRLISFTYEKTNGEKSEVRVEPYYLAAYRNAWYIKAIHNLEKRTYKLNRIWDLSIENIPFIRDEKRFDFSQNDFGFDDVHVELIIHNRNDVLEYRYSDDQCIKRIDDTTFLFEANMKEYSAYALIKNLGNSCKVIEPAYLRDRYIEECKGVLEKYGE